ncbi:MAG: putative peptidoglycan glycosyltransferase FtsW [Candidatus Parcubacteria bacterium]|nr:MAG: stage V sporulation protein E [Candidatus Parcubacteria bacterium]
MNLKGAITKRKSVDRPHELDKKMLIALGLILFIGLAMLFTASAVVSFNRFGNQYHYLLRQLPALALGLLAFFVAQKVDFRFWKKYAFAFLLISIGLLLLVFIPGLQSDYGTSRSWINLFGFSFQPSELVKATFLIYLATWLEARQKDLSSFSSGTLPFFTILVVISLLMMLQPDFGSLVIIIAMAIGVFFVGGGKLKHLIITALVGLTVLFVSPLFRSDGGYSYQDNRLRCFVDPSFDTQDVCFHINQSLIAIGSGGVFGRGLGQSRQKFMYLPEVWGDSIFPIIAEEIGFILTTLFIILLFYLFYRIFLVAKLAPDRYGRNLATGVGLWLAIQTFFNIGGQLNLIPMTGVPLPFISAGGSSILSSLIAVGLVVNISKYTKEPSRR